MYINIADSTSILICALYFPFSEHDQPYSVIEQKSKERSHKKIGFTFSNKLPTNSRKLQMSSIPNFDFLKHLSDIDESDEDDNVEFFGDDDDEEVVVVDAEKGDKEDEVPGTKAAYEDLILAKYGNNHETALIKYNDEFQELLRKTEEIARNRIAANTHSQYNKANIIFIRWLYFYAKHVLKQEYIDLFEHAYLDGQEVALMEQIGKIVTQEETCPVNVDRFQTKTFFTLFLTLKGKDDLNFSYSCYNGKRSESMHMFAFTNDIWSPKERDVLSKLMQSL